MRDDLWGSEKSISGGPCLLPTPLPERHPRTNHSTDQSGPDRAGPGHRRLPCIFLKVYELGSRPTGRVTKSDCRLPRAAPGYDRQADIRDAKGETKLIMTDAGPDFFGGAHRLTVSIARPGIAQVRALEEGSQPRPRVTSSSD